MDIHFQRSIWNANKPTPHSREEHIRKVVASCKKYPFKYAI